MNKDQYAIDRENHQRADNTEMLLAFGEAFKPWAATMQGGLNVIRTEAINGMKVPAGVMAALYDPKYKVGITAVAFANQQMKVYLEVTVSPGDGVVVISSTLDSRCTIAGDVFAKAFTEFVQTCQRYAT